ncbi:MAG: 4'-phosphopantetheinyl transferase superfamily protein [Anaerolinea sp.]|nr:4'-phosphopantetheinyl transferase superfamily protein [Anaerolinea sp.]
MIIHWLTQTLDDHPDLRRGVPPEGLLSGYEFDIFTHLKTDKRRRDWLLGRWTAKNLLQSINGGKTPLDAISIFNRPDGSPYCPEYPHYSLSISHSGDRALVAVAQGGEIGVDIEHIEPRFPGFVDDYFTGSEQAMVYLSSDRDRLINAIWSAKESALKAIRAGLTLDARAVSCPIESPVALDWTPFSVTYTEARHAKGWWRQEGEYVLTLVTLDKETQHD